MPLLLHLLAFTVLAGGSLGGIVLHASLTNALRTAPAQAAPLGRLMKQFGLVAQVGALLMLLTGLGLLASRGWADVGHAWLSAKLGLFIALFLNGLLVAKPAGARLGATLAAGGDRAAVAPLLQRLTLFHVVQTAGFLAIVSLAVFGPR